MVAKVAAAVFNFLREICAGLLIIIVMLLLLAIFTIIYNPVVFWVWAMIAPKSAARSLYNIKGKEDHPLDLPGKFFWEMNRKLDFLLPWRCKKEFLRVTQLKEANPTEEVRFFHGEDQAAIISKNWLSREAKERLWPMIGNSLHELMLPHMGSLNVEQFSVLVWNNEWQTVVEYINKYTPSERFLEIVVNAAIGKGKKNNEAFNFLCRYAKVKSLPANIINSIYKNTVIDEEDRMAIEKALSIYGQRRLIITGCDNHELWEKFCNRLKGGDGIFPENQILLNLQQYKDYHNAGFGLCNQAIIYFLSKEDMNMAEAVIKHELVEKKAALTGQVCTLIEANAKLGEIYLNLLAEAEKK